jgi:phosphoglycerol transferase MdoB-like AlkP superfamily enzyme
MEQAGAVIDRGSTIERAYEKCGWMILSASAGLGIVAAVVTTLPPLYVFSSSIFEGTYPIMGALGTALVSFNILALVMALVPYRKHERWAWYTLWILPLQWLSQFVLSPDLIYLVLAVLTTAGLILPYKRFFSRPEEPVRVR